MCFRIAIEGPNDRVAFRGIGELCYQSGVSNGRTYGNGDSCDADGIADGECDNDGAIAEVLRCRDGTRKGMNASGGWNGIETEFLECRSQTDGSVKTGGVQIMNDKVQHSDGVATILCGIFLNIESCFSTQGVIEIVGIVLADMFGQRVAVF